MHAVNGVRLSSIIQTEVNACRVVELSPSSDLSHIHALRKVVLLSPLSHLGTGVGAIYLRVLLLVPLVFPQHLVCANATGCCIDTTRHGSIKLHVQHMCNELCNERMPITNTVIGLGMVS